LAISKWQLANGNQQMAISQNHLCSKTITTKRISGAKARFIRFLDGTTNVCPDTCLPYGCLAAKVPLLHPSAYLLLNRL
jgi:hypothetical protein